jgi:hypothetical protein
MTAVTALRSTIASVLDNPGVWSVFAYPPASPIANSVILSPDDPYLEPQNNDYSTISPLANFKITCIVPMYDNQGNLNGIEDFMVRVFNKLYSGNLDISVKNWSAPTVLGDEVGRMLAADLSFSILTSWS